MFKNYIKIAWRSLRKNKLYSTVNIIGLSIGIASCLLIGLYILNETSYDNFHQNGDRIVRVTMEYQFAGSKSEIAVTGTKAGPQFKRLFPAVENFVRTMKYPVSLSNGDHSFDEKNLVYADAAFFDVFSFPLLEGNKQTVLDGPNKIVLTEQAARKYFGKENPVGKAIRINGGTTDYWVTGIAANVPLNSQIQFDVLVSFNSLNASKSEVWHNANYITYLLLHYKSQVSALGDEITDYTKREGKTEFGMEPTGNDYMTFKLEPLRTVHLYSKLPGLESNGNITHVYILSIVALMILLIACVNYTNMATAQSVGRSTEIGIRKVMGARRTQLLKQFLGESFMVAVISLVAAVILTVLALPLFNNITGKTFTVGLLLRPVFISGVVILIATIGMVAGAYPALVLSSTRLSSILKSGLRISSSGNGVRKSLIVLQFVIAIFLVASTIIVLNQVSYIQHKDVGYNREQVVVLPVDGKTSGQYDLLKDAIRNIPGVLSVTGSYEEPTSIGWGDGIQAADGNGKKELSLNASPVDLDYLQTMGMQLVAGRDFLKADFMLQDTSNAYANYRGSYILNEKAAAELGWTPEQAIGKTISRGVPGLVVGVVKNFHFESLHQPIGPLLIFLDTTQVQQLFVKVQAENTITTLSRLESVWKSRVTHRPFDFHFMDEDFNSLYISEKRTAELFSVFSMLAISLACLGLFALAAFSTIQRTKEIGIRKVLGATVSDITILVTRDFLLLVAIAVLIATPAAWWAGNTWLSDFAYRTQIGWWIFLLAGVIAAVIAFATVSFHAVRAALTNPVKALRSE